jgi:hypothetical protein
MTMAKSATKSGRSSRSSSRAKAPSQAAAPKQSAEERARHEAEKHAPVSLESGGCYDAAELIHGGGLTKAVDRQGGNREVEVNKALESARLDRSTTTNAPNALPEHQVMRAEVELSPGVEVGTGKDKQTIGGVMVEELRQVYVGDGEVKSAADVVGAVQGAGGQSDVVSLAPVGDKPKAAKPQKPADPGSPDVPATTGETGEAGTTSNIEAVVDGIEDAQADAGADGNQA